MNTLCNACDEYQTNQVAPSCPIHREFTCLVCGEEYAVPEDMDRIPTICWSCAKTH